MSDQLPDGPDEGHPILTGLLALAGVALAVGLILGLLVLAGTRVAGLGGGSDAATSGSDRSMYIPPLSKTPSPTGAQVTLAPGSSTPSSSQDGQDKQKKPKKKKAPRSQLSLSSAVTSASPMQQIDLTGTYPGGEGAILQVQRFADGGWQDFPVTASVSNETFSTYVQTSQPGVNRFRVIDTDTKKTSNEVRVKIG